MNARPSLIAIIHFLIAGAALFPSVAKPQVRVTDLQAQFDRESNPIRKAKLLQRLGDAEFQESHREEARENFEGVAKIFETYRDNVRSALTALKGTRPDAEKHSDGYRQLQIQLRRGLRDLQETILSTPQDLRPRLESLRADLIAADDDLIKLLFPRRRKPATEKGEVAAATQGSGETERPGIVSGSRVTADPDKAGIAPGALRSPVSEKQASAPATVESAKPEPTEQTRIIDPANNTSDVVEPQARHSTKDYLSDLEADKIRDAETSNQRIKLLLTFAADRLKKFQYELAHPSASGHHTEMLIFLMNAYTGCVDDAAEYIDVGAEKQENVHEGIKEMIARGKEFLIVLEELADKGTDREIYKETLDDAIEGTRDAIHDAEKAKKENAPPPVRRRN